MGHISIKEKKNSISWPNVVCVFFSFAPLAQMHYPEQCWLQVVEEKKGAKCFSIFGPRAGTEVFAFSVSVCPPHRIDHILLIINTDISEFVTYHNFYGSAHSSIGEMRAGLPSLDKGKRNTVLFVCPPKYLEGRFP